MVQCIYVDFSASAIEKLKGHFMLNFKHKRRTALVTIDILILAAVFLFTAAITLFVGNETFKILAYIGNFALFATLIMTTRALVRVYTNVWRYANSKAYLQIVASDIIGGVIALVISYVSAAIYIGAWRSVAFVAMANCVTLVSRFIYQQNYRHGNLSEINNQDRNNKIGIAIVGAGQVGVLLAEELLYNKNAHYEPICFIDSDTEKVGSTILGLPVHLDDDSVVQKIKKLPVQEVFIAIPSLDGDALNTLHSFYTKTGCKVKIYDAPLKEERGRAVVREIKIEDLLFRKSLQVTSSDAYAYYRDKVVLVTGGGGSIGSELCRGIAKCSPKQLIIYDIYENNAYDIQQELTRKYRDALDLQIEIGSVRDRDRLDAVFAHYRPDIVFHAAAHKHVPLMEHSNCEAIKNNVLGTYNTADMAEKYEAESFILISTDKAVNPTNVMGASKRLCEWVVQCRFDSKTKFSAVRFGNVLGSNGSVIPLFRRQIAEGGPVTITDKRIIRYFMTIPEAAGLVMQAGAMAKCGELFVLDMGKPVKIIDLAENMIKLSGLTPYEDIDIIETGLRPGEKLYEELLIKTEKLTKTENNMIFIEQDTPPTREFVEETLDYLRAIIKERNSEISSAAITEAMKKIIPTYHSPEEVNADAEKSSEMRKIMV